MNKRIYPIGYYLILPEKASGMIPGLGMTSSLLLEKDKQARGTGSSGPFSPVGF
jgi:hypothetical protein